jgi:hypothetical protein
MVDHGLNLHQAGSPRLRSGSFALVQGHRKPIVMASLIAGDLAAALAASFLAYFLARMTGLTSPEPQPMLLEDVHNIQGPWVHTHAPETMIGVEIRRNLCSRRSQLLKRMLDILLAIPLALLVLPVVALAAVSIKLIDPGPALYLQKRIGRGCAKGAR